MITIKVNGSSINNVIDWNSVAYSEQITKAPDTLAFDINTAGDKTIPSMADVVTMEIDGDVKFSGLITEKSEKMQGGMVVGYSFSCKDDQHTLDRKLVVKSYTAMAADLIIKDIIDTFTDGTFTYTNVPAGLPTLASIKFNYEYPSQALQKICDLLGYDWYIDSAKDLHVFLEESLTAPFDIDDTSGNFEWQSLEFERNILELRNSIIVRGGEYLSAISEANAIDKYVADGVQEVFNLALRYSSTGVSVNGVAKTVGIENVDDPALFDVLYNYTEKYIKFKTSNRPAASDTVKIWGSAHIPLIARVVDGASVAAYGEYEHIEIRKSIVSIDEAQSYAKAQLRKWASGSSEGTFKTYLSTLRTGMSININSVKRGVDAQYKINRITGKCHSKDTMEFTVSFLASGETTFTDIMMILLGREREQLVITDDEVLQRLYLVPEIIEVMDTITPSKRTAPYTWGTTGVNDLVWDFGTWA